MSNKRVYLPGLNALRFFAALLVIIAHVELIKGQMGYFSYDEVVNAFNPGGLGVYFFFVLSGFLITYLLYEEKNKTATINVKKFYVRRLLRIWPLYYLITILAFFVLPNFEFIHLNWGQQFFDVNYSQNLILFLVMLPNLALALNPAVPHAGQLWSIGVEEQFYLVWPVLFRKVRNIPRLLLLIILFMLGLKGVIVIIWKLEIVEITAIFITVKNFIVMSKFECMAIGGIGAYLVKFEKYNILKYFYDKRILALALFCLPTLNYFCPEILKDGIHLPYSVVFLILILNISTNKSSFLKLENKYFTFLGNISYGLYMYHMIVIAIVVRTVNVFFPKLAVFNNNILIYISSILFTIIISWLSYEYIEKPFLMLKSKFTIIKSGKI